MNNEDKKAAFLKKAQDNKENFELHKQLIEESIKPLQKHLGKESIKHFYDTGSVSGGFLLALMDYAEKYADTKVKNFSSNTMLAVTDGIQNINESPVVAVCEHELWIPYKGAMVQCKKCGKNQLML